MPSLVNSSSIGDSTHTSTPVQRGAESRVLGDESVITVEDSSISGVCELSASVAQEEEDEEETEQERQVEDRKSVV